MPATPNFSIGKTTKTSSVTLAERTTALKYDNQSETRKGYTGYEKDDESGLDFAQARYYNPAHGRFTSVDPLTASATIRDPQTFITLFLCSEQSTQIY